MTGSIRWRIIHSLALHTTTVRFMMSADNSTDDKNKAGALISDSGFYLHRIQQSSVFLHYIYIYVYIHIYPVPISATFHIFLTLSSSSTHYHLDGVSNRM